MLAGTMLLANAPPVPVPQPTPTPTPETQPMAGAPQPLGLITERMRTLQHPQAGTAPMTPPAHSPLAATAMPPGNPVTSTAPSLARVAAQSAQSARPRPPKSSSSIGAAILVFVVIVLLGGGGTAAYWWFRMRH
jgi:hypothetical protein